MTRQTRQNEGVLEAEPARDLAPSNHNTVSGVTSRSNFWLMVRWFDRPIAVVPFSVAIWVDFGVTSTSADTCRSSSKHLLEPE